MKFKFVVIYELPHRLFHSYGIKPITFTQVDHFSCLAMPNVDQVLLTRHIKTQGYYRPARTFLVLDRDTGACFTIQPEEAKE